MQKTVITSFKMKGREVLSSYASMALEGEMSATVALEDNHFPIITRNIVPCGISFGEKEATCISISEAIESIEKNIVPILPQEIIIEKPSDIIHATHRFDLNLIRGAGKNKKEWGGNACLAASTVFVQTLLSASGVKPWQLKLPVGAKEFFLPNIAFIMASGGKHVLSTKQDIQTIFFFSMKDKSIKNVLTTAVQFFRQLEKNLARDNILTGFAKTKGLVFAVKDNFEALKRLNETAKEIGLKADDYAFGTDNAFSEMQKDKSLRESKQYDMHFSGDGIKTQQEIVDFNGQLISTVSNFISIEDPAGENDIETHRMMNKIYGERIQLVVDDAAVTQLRFIIPYLASPKRKLRAGNSMIIKLNQVGTFSEACLAADVVLGISDPAIVTQFLEARGDMGQVLTELSELGIQSIEEALLNIKKGGFSVFFANRSIDGGSELLASMPLIYGGVSNRVWLNGGAPNGERNLNHYNPLIRAEEELTDYGVNAVVSGWSGLPAGVNAVYRDKA